MTCRNCGSVNLKFMGGSIKTCLDCGWKQDRLGQLDLKQLELPFDEINPSHYRQGRIECIDYITDKELSFLEGNVVKYVTRWRHKNGLEDLKKAQWYMNKLVEVNDEIT